MNKTKANSDHSVAAPEADGQSILIVDDDKITARALAAILTEVGFRTNVFHSGREAIRYVKTERVAAAIIDVHLPDLNGLVLSMSLRELLGPETPIFVVSGDTSMETINSLPHVGATHFFAKPMSTTYVIEKLRTHLGIS